MLQNVDSRVTTIEGNVITQGVRDTTGDTPKGNLLLQNAKGETVATVTGLEDYALKDQTVTVDDDGNAVFKVTDRYDPSKSYDVKLDGLVTEAGIATANNLKVEADNDGDGNNGNWTITDASKPEGQQTFTNTTLDKAGSTVADGTTANGKVYGKTYTVKDTSGNTIQLIDVASGNVLQNVDSKVGDTNYSSTNYIHNEDNLTTAASILDSNIKATADKVDAGWTATAGGNSIAVNPTETGTTTLNFAGDKNINVTADKASSTINVKLDPTLEVESVTASKDVVTIDGNKTYSLKDIGYNTQAIHYAGNRTAVEGTLSADRIENENGSFIVDNSGNVVVGKQVVVNSTSGTITGLSNTEWKGTTITPDRAATEGQLRDVSDTVNTGWTATDGTTEVNVNPANNTLKFAGDKNIAVTAETDKDGNNSINVALSDNLDVANVKASGDVFTTNIAGEKEYSLKDIGYNTQAIKYAKDHTAVDGLLSADRIENENRSFMVEENGNITAGGVKVYATTGEVTGLTNTTWDGTTNNETRAATEGQLKAVSDDVNAGWIATDSQNHEVNITPDNNTLNFAGDKNIKVTANEADGSIDVSLKDDVVLGDYTTGGSGVLIGGSSGTISATNAITVGEDQGLIIDGQKKEIQGLSNTTWNEKIANDAAVEGSTAASTAATQGQLQEVSKVANAGWTASDGTNSISVKPNETLKFVGDENLTVSADGTDKELKVSLNDDITLGDGENAIKIDGTNGTLNIGSTFAVAEDGTVLSDGDVIADADGEKYSLSEVGKYAVRYDKTNDGTSTITLADGDDLSGTRIKNVADGVDPKDAVNVSQLEAVKETANAGWNAKAGGNTINVKPNETLNFEGDGNITVSATSGTSSELKFGLNHNITLDNVENANTMLVLNTDGKNADGISGYIPKNYKDDEGHINNFIKEHGGFAIYYANPSLTTGDMTGTFGVTTDGVVHAKDVISYYSASSGSQSDVIRYSLNDVGDIVTQIAHGKFDGTDMEYTLISDFTSEKDKDTPFQSTDKPERTIGLAVREDGAVVVGAVVDKSGNLDDSGIRINAEKRVNKDGTTSSDNMATITGLENTTWTPPAPIATFANDVTETSRAATESQLNDLYNTVAAYNTYMDANGSVSINYNAMTLRGDAYNTTTHSGGTIINNVGYAKENPDGTIDGSQAVNVDYLNDAINNAVKDGGAISDSDRHLQEGTYHVNDQGKVELIVADEKGENQSTVTIDNVASKGDITELKGDITNLNDKINNINIAETDVKGGSINEDGTISLKTENEDGTTTNVTLKGQLTDSGVVQEGTTFDKETGTITITSQDKYSGETSSVKVEGIASKDDIEAVNDTIGATSKEDLKDKYKDTEYLKDENGETVETLADADIALDHAVQGLVTNDKYLNSRIDNVEKRLGDVEQRIDKVGAMAAAIANLRTMGFDPEAPTEIAIGVGQYKSETGIAIGVFHYPNQDFMLSASLSSSGDELMGGIGATWKLGRKSAAERAKDEEARHLEQAEEMKKLAQQEKVKAQAQRHAKLLAERQQASQKNA